MIACISMLLMVCISVASIFGACIPDWLWMLPSVVLTLAIILYQWRTLKMFVSVPPALVDFDGIIAHNETVACTNATVIINQDGEVTGWHDNTKPIVFAKEDDND